ncbi:Rha family transcriptional regulator [Maridesulfovibrio sp.]|uniref:Rha family transcriptional regulator n=1 Tax=Maridesulfovibrio sp. TaxID=2795000 RepID=UPI002A18D752|nr:Rha family transcriptional regulator [Maridesulfovibrio sp.]
MAGKNLANSRTSDNSSVVGSPTLVVSDGKPVVSSIEISKHFGKQHKDVLRKIESLEIPDDFGRRNFTPSSYINSQNKQMPCFNLTRDGFAYLVMGFTGKKASEWKIRYLEAFNAMEQELIRRQCNTPMQTPAELPEESEHPRWYNFVYAFVQAECRPDPGSRISKEAIYEHYCNFCIRNNASPVHRIRFFTALYCHATYIKETRPHIDGMRPRMLANIAVTPWQSAPKEALKLCAPPTRSAPPYRRAITPEVHPARTGHNHMDTAKEVMLRDIESRPREERQALLMAYDALIEAEQVLDGEVRNG